MPTHDLLTSHIPRGPYRVGAASYCRRDIWGPDQCVAVALCNTDDTHEKPEYVQAVALAQYLVLAANNLPALLQSLVDIIKASDAAPHNVNSAIDAARDLVRTVESALVVSDELSELLRTKQ